MIGPFGALPFGIAEFGVGLPVLAGSAVPLVNAVVLVEIEAADLSVAATANAVPLTFGGYPFDTFPSSITSGVSTIYLSDRDWTSRPTDTVPNTHFEGRARTITLDRTAPLTPNADRRVVLGVSEVRIDNLDGRFDGANQALSVDGRSVRIKLLKHVSNAYAAAVTIFAGTGVELTAEQESARVIVRDRSYVLEVPLLSLYGGTGGADGSSLIAGRPITQVYGICRGVSPDLVDEPKRIFRVHDRVIQALLAVYARGNPLIAGMQQASYAALDAATPTAGTYDWAITATGCFIRLGSISDGTVTVDVEGDAFGGYVSAVADIVQRLVGRVTVGTVPVDSSAFSSLASALPGAIGVMFQGSQITIAEAVSRVCSGTGCYWGDSMTGLISIGRVEPPFGATIGTLDTTNIIGEIEPIRMPDDVMPSVWRVNATYRQNWTVQSASELVAPPVITEERRLELTQAALAIPAQAIPLRQSRQILARDVAVGTLFDNQADAIALASTILNLHAPGRLFCRVSVGYVGHEIPIGAEVFVQWPRYGLASGRNMRVVGTSVTGWSVDLFLFG